MVWKAFVCFGGRCRLYLAVDLFLAGIAYTQRYHLFRSIALIAVGVYVLKSRLIVSERQCVRVHLLALVGCKHNGLQSGVGCAKKESKVRKDSSHCSKEYLTPRISREESPADTTRMTHVQHQKFPSSIASYVSTVVPSLFLDPRAFCPLR